MNIKKRLLTIPLLLSLIIGGSVFSVAQAADDPSIEGALRVNIKAAMKKYILDNTVDGRLYVYDSVDGKLMELKFDAIHEGVVRKGEFYVSCADFTTKDGQQVDLDILVKTIDANLIGSASLVHSINGEAREYHLERDQK